MTIYDSIGGAPAVAAAVDDFYVRVTGDPTLAGYFDGIDMAKLKSRSVARSPRCAQTSSSRSRWTSRVEARPQ